MAVELPRGTITFLFTDVERSTELARRSVSGYAELIRTHFEIIETAVQGASGSVVKNTGDGVLAVFGRVSDALVSAGAIQTGIGAHDWPMGVDVKVRVGIHTGEAAFENGDYFGIEVHRAARVMAAGHGGQVLVSEAAHNLAGDSYEFRDLGRHLLKGLENDETIYQLVVPGLPQEFPPLVTASLIPNNLPTRVASMVGRETDREALSGMVLTDRLVTLLGPGGVGKTSLAVSVAGASIESFPGGVTFVDLSAVSEPGFVIPSIAAEVDAEPRTFEGIVDRLQGPKRLLVLDNFEQVVDAGPDIGKLMERVADVHILTTSQVPLRLAAERRYLLGPLPTDTGPESPGVELFMERARAVCPGFQADPEDLGELVRALGGLPLAIELVAARANLLSVDQMLERLRTDRLSYGAATDAPERQRSLEAALEWSHGLLAPATQEVFRRLSLFTIGFTLEAAEAVSAGPDVDALEEIAELVDRSLVTRRVDSAGRFRMLDGIRRFARTRLEDSDDFEPTIDRFVGFYLELSEDAYQGLQSDKGHWWQTQLDEELDNIREVLTTLRSRGRADEALGLLGSIWRFYLSRGHLLELQGWLNVFIEMPQPADSVGRAKGVMAQGAVYYWQQRADQAVDAYFEAAELARATGERRLVADALFGLATSLGTAGRVEEAGRYLEEAKTLYTDLGDQSGLADVVAGEAFVARYKAGGSLVGLGPQLAEASRLYATVGRRIQGTQTVYAEAGVAIAEGRIAEARDLVVGGLQTGMDLADVFLQAWGVEYLALVEYESGNLERAGLLTGAVEVAREQIGGGWGPESVGLDNAGTLLRRSLDQDEAEEIIGPGRELGLEGAIGLASAHSQGSQPSS